MMWVQQPFLPQRGDQLGGVLHHHALAAFGRRGVVRGLQVVVRLDAERAELDHVDRLGFRLHDVRQFDETRLVEAQVGGDHGREFRLDHFQAGVDLARHRGLAVGDLDLAGEGGLRAIPQCGEHLAGLVGIIVDRLLAQDHQARLLLLDQLEEDARRGQRLHGVRRGHVDGAIGAHGQAVAQVCGEVGRANADHDHLFGHPFLAQAQCFFQRDVVERVGGQLDAVSDHAAAVGLDLDAHVVIHDALVAHQNFHQLFL
jgi:hypothetical protein